MTDLKRDIIKRVVLSKDVPANAGKFVNLHRSILIHGLDNVEVQPQMVQFEDFKPMFEDFMTFSAAVGDNGDEVADGAIIRIARIGGEFIGSIFIKGLVRAMPKHYSYVTGFVVSEDGVEFKYYAPYMREGVKKSGDEFTKAITRILYVASTYTTELINPAKPLPNKLFYRKLGAQEKELYKEYTIDISKPRIVVKAKSKPNSEESISRAEHLRRGHWRTSKLGKRYFVRSTTVNKGAVRKIVKDYKV